MSKVYSEAEIERAIRETIDKVDERGGPQKVGSGRKLHLETAHQVYDMGAIFKAQTVKGSYNYVMFLGDIDGWVLYNHGDRAKKVPRQRFVDLIEAGDLEFVSRDKADPERLSLAVLGLMAMSNGVSFNDYMKMQYNYGDGSDANRYNG